MKNVLFTTTALVMTAGFAYADGHEANITFSAGAEFGIVSIDDGTDDDTNTTAEMTVDITGERTTDSGLTFGATGEISALDGFASVDSTAEWEDRYVYLKSGPHALHFGDTDGGYDKAIIGIDTGGINDEADFYNFGDAGFDGLGDDGAHVLRYDYKADGLLGDGSATFSASYEENDGEDDGSIFGIGANADLAGFNVGVGYQMGTEADVDASIIGVSVGGTFDQFSVKGMLANASTDADEIEDVMGWAVSGVFDASDDLSVGVNASGAISDDELSEYTGFGVWADYSLGDGLTLTAAAGQSSPEEGDDETRFGFGLAMSF